MYNRTKLIIWILVCVSIINFLNFSNMLRDENVLPVKWEHLAYLKMNPCLDAKHVFVLTGLIFVGRCRIMYGPNWAVWKGRSY